MWTGLSYTVLLKRNTEMLPQTIPANSFQLHPLLNSTAVTPQQFITSLEKIFHGETPFHYDEHHARTLKVGKEMNGERGKGRERKQIV